MFVCAVSRPLLTADGEVLFDGKIGIFPFIETAIAQRESKNRPKGTPYTKPIDVVTRRVMKETLIAKVTYSNVVPI